MDTGVVDTGTLASFGIVDTIAGIILNQSQKYDGGYSLEPPRGGGSDEYQQSMF